MIQRRIFSESKDEVAVVICGSGSERTNNSLSSDDEYQNIDVLCGLQPVSFDMLEKLAEVEATEHVCDFVDAIVVALDVIVDKTKNLKFSSRRVVLLSNLGGTFNDSQQSIIAEGMKNSDLSLTIVCPFDVQDIGDDLGKLSAGQQKAVKYVGRILEAVNGDSYTFSQAMPALMSYEKKRTRPTPWNANLEIRARHLHTNLIIHQGSGGQAQTVETVCRETSCDMARLWFHLPTRTGQPWREARQVPGRGLQVLGFTDEANIKRHYYMGDKTSYVVARKGDESAGAALSALIQALKKSKMVAIVRYAFSDKSAPRMGFLSPRIKERYECLVFIQLPYMEDLRRFTFLPLDTNKDNIPTDTQLSLFDDLIAAMDLTAVDIDGEPEELFKSSQTSNPYLQRLYQCIQHRAMHPKDPLPPTPQYIADAIKTPKAVSELAEPVLKKIAAAFPLEEVAPVKVPHKTMELDPVIKARIMSQTQMSLPPRGLVLMSAWQTWLPQQQQR
ncbi:hypothetical protein MTO96_048203 [Rhipicephalus appendiculatus]